MAILLLAVAAASAVLAVRVDSWFFLAFRFALTGADGAWLGMSPRRVLDAAAAGEQDAGTGPAGLYHPDHTYWPPGDPVADRPVSCSTPRTALAIDHYRRVGVGDSGRLEDGLLHGRREPELGE